MDAFKAELAELGGESIRARPHGEGVAAADPLVERCANDIGRPAATLQVVERRQPRLCGQHRGPQAAAGQLGAGGAQAQHELILDAVEEKARQLLVVLQVGLFLLAADLVQRRLGDEQVPAFHQAGHLPVKERE